MSETNEPEEPQMTPEEYAKAREDAMKHLEKEIVLLKVEKEYENLLADVEEAKTRRITMIAQRARFYAQDNPSGGEPEGQPEGPQAPKPKRKLKPKE